MKKILSIALVLILSLSLLAGCGGKKEEAAATSDLANAKAFLEGLYQTGKAGEVMDISKDKDVTTIVMVGGVNYTVEWSINVTEGAADSVKISESSTENCVLIDLPDVAETDILFSAVATVKDAEGKTEAATFNYKMACTLGDLELLDKASALADGEKLSGTPSLTGDIVEIKVPYDAATQSISVVIQVGMDAGNLVLCNGLVGDYVDGLVVGDNICVKGVLGKTAGVVGFDAGCTMVYVIKADGSTPGADTTTTVPGDDSATTIPGATTTAGNGVTSGNSGNNNTPTTAKPTTGNSQLKLVTDEAKILADIAKLGKNECTPYIAQLTGKVQTLSPTADDEKYGSMTLTFRVGNQNIKCYKMKGDKAKDVAPGDTITVKGVIKNYWGDNADKGTIEFYWHEASGTEVTLVKLVEAPKVDLSTTEKILAAAFALKSGDSLSEEVTLTGKVVAIEEAYSDTFGNITLSITVDGKTLKCYRMKGTVAALIKEGDYVTVKGYITNYNGNIQFGQGCEATKRVAGTSTGPETDEAKILADAFSLAPGTALSYKASLTGTITKIATEYNSAYQNVTVIIEVGGKEIKCYRLKAPTGDGAKNLKVGDVITVTGMIKNYQHSSGDCEVEFDQGCTFVKK